MMNLLSLKAHSCLKPVLTTAQAATAVFMMGAAGAQAQTVETPENVPIPTQKPIMFSMEQVPTPMPKPSFEKFKNIDANIRMVMHPEYTERLAERMSLNFPHYKALVIDAAHFQALASDTVTNRFKAGQATLYYSKQQNDIRISLAAFHRTSNTVDALVKEMHGLASCKFDKQDDARICIISINSNTSPQLKGVLSGLPESLQPQMDEAQVAFYKDFVVRHEINHTLDKDLLTGNKDGMFISHEQFERLEQNGLQRSYQTYLFENYADMRSALEMSIEAHTPEAARDVHHNLKELSYIRDAGSFNTLREKAVYQWGQPFEEFKQESAKNFMTHSTGNGIRGMLANINRDGIAHIKFASDPRLQNSMIELRVRDAMKEHIYTPEQFIDLHQEHAIRSTLAFSDMPKASAALQELYENHLIGEELVYEIHTTVKYSPAVTQLQSDLQYASKEEDLFDMRDYLRNMGAIFGKDSERSDYYRAAYLENEKQLDYAYMDMVPEKEPERYIVEDVEYRINNVDIINDFEANLQQPQALRMDAELQQVGR